MCEAKSSPSARVFHFEGISERNISPMPPPKPFTPSSVTSYLIAILQSSEHTPYIGEPISQLAHSLQAGHLALSATKPSANDETIVAALLHDIGQFAPQADLLALLDGMDTSVRDMDPGGGSVGRYSHDELGSRFLAALGFPAKTCTLVGEHVNAKRYLCGVDAAYYDLLSEASKESLEFQGGPMEKHEKELYDERLGAEWVRDICRLRNWDDGAKVETLSMSEIEGLDRYEGMIERVLERAELKAKPVS